MSNRDTTATLEYHEATRPHASGKSFVFLVALGHPDRAALGLAS